MSYIEEINFRNDDVNKLTNPNAFTYDSKNQKVEINAKYNINSSILKILALDDTFHDLSKQRNGYEDENFNQNGPANYLLTGQWVNGNKINDYKEKLNGDEYKNAKFPSFESKVTRSIELKNGLQPAEISITYDEILRGINITTEPPTITSELLNKVKSSNGSINICKDPNPTIYTNLSGGAKRIKLNDTSSITKPSSNKIKTDEKRKKRQSPPPPLPPPPPRVPVSTTRGKRLMATVKRSSVRSDTLNALNIDKNASFSDYMIAITEADLTKLQSAYKKISMFVRWFLYSDDLNDFSTISTTATNMNIIDTSTKILADAGLSFLRDCFAIPDSKITPFLAIPCFLDSASTSTNPLDPNEPIYFENLDEEHIIPIISNYFSCKKYFMCYLLNPRSNFDSDNLFNFSLAIFKIPDEEGEYKQAIQNIRSKNLTDPSYNEACTTIKNYIYTYPDLVARYFFGEVKKEITGQNPDNLSCGTCGAGVPYIGKVMKTLINNKKIVGSGINGNWSNGQNVKGIKTTLNALKSEGSLNSRIPISDSRILKIFCKQGTNPLQLNMSPDEYNELFQILADYKRTGDYQQSYTVLKEILKSGTNTGCYTFCSGDELSALVGRLLGVPTIYQVGASATFDLYRCDKFKGSRNEQIKIDIKNKYKIIEDYKNDINEKLLKTKFFIENYYEKICILRDQLFNIYKYYKKKYDASTNDKKKIIFIMYQLLQAINILTTIIEKSNKIIEYSGEEENLNTFISKINTYYTETTEILNSSTSTEDEGILEGNKTRLIDVIKLISNDEERNKVFDLYFYIKQTFIFLDVEHEEKTFDTIDGIPQSLSTGDETSIQSDTKINIDKPSLSLNIKNNYPNSKIVKGFPDFLIGKPKPTDIGSRNFEKKISAWTVEFNIFLNKYNNYLDEFNNDELFKEFKFDDEDKQRNYENTLLNTNYTKVIEKIDNLMRTLCSQDTKQQIISLIDQTLTSLRTRGGTRISNNLYENIPDNILTNGINNELSYDGNIQFGGAGISNQQEYNAYIIKYEIQKIVIKILNRCASYMNNVINQENRKSNLTDTLTNISNIYKTDDFCNQLLFENDEDYTIESENIGFVIALKLLANKYSYSDLRVGDQNENIITVIHMLEILKLQYVKLMLMLLAISSDRSALLLELIGIDINDKQYEDQPSTTTILLKYIQDNFPLYHDIYNNLFEVYVNDDIYTIMNFAILNGKYYGSNSISYNEIKDLCSVSIHGSEEPLIKNNWSSDIFLNEKLMIYLDAIYSRTSQCLGIALSGSSPGSSRTPSPLSPSSTSTSSRTSRGGYKKHKITKKNHDIKHKITKRKYK